MTFFVIFSHKPYKTYLNVIAMKSKSSIVMMCILFLISGITHLSAQVTVGLDETPEKYATLQIKDKAINKINGPLDDITAKNGGLLLPRVKLEKKKELLPFVTQQEVTDNGQEYKDAKKLHTGLVVYNLEENDTEELCVGINQWDGEQWNCLQNKMGNAIATITDCSTFGFFGIYKDNEPLNNGNYMTVKLKVTKAGAYTITARVAQSTDHSKDNGYYFTHTGVFMSPGDYTLTVPGAGTPLVFTPNGNPGDPITVTFNDKPLVDGNGNLCPKNIIVEDTSKKPMYKLDCRTVQVVGFGVLDQQVMPSTASTGQKAYIQVTIDVDAAAEGALYEITTNEVAGMSFYAKGKLTADSRQIITLEPVEGSVPNATGEQSFIISTNSITSSSTCNAKVLVAYTKKKMLTLSDYWNTYGFGPGEPTNNPSGNSGGSRKILMEPTNFGTLPNSIVKVEAIEIVSIGRDDGSVGDCQDCSRFIYGDALKNKIKSENIDIIHYSVRYHTDQATANVLKEFMENGGVVIAMCDNLPNGTSTGLAHVNAKIMLQTVFGNTGINVASANGGGALYKLREIDDEITNGPFGDLRGKWWGEDTTASLAVTGIPEEDMVVYTTAEDYSQAGVPSGIFNGGLTMFRHKRLPFFYIGDGGFLAANNASSPTACPFKITADNKPAPKSSYGRESARRVEVYNSHIWANIMAWAVRTAQR